ncbi:MAG: BtpA/SgcQ family protein [Bacillota bacterium]
MWIDEMFHNQKPVIGMVHLDALPGTARYDNIGGVSTVIEHAKIDYQNLVDGGISGVIFCNENDKPYSKDVGKEIVAAMTTVIHRVTGGKPAVPFGVDVQWDAKAAIAIALAVGASFVRGITCGTFCGDLGHFTPNAEEIVKYRHAIGADHIKILTNMMPEFSYSLDRRPLELIAQTVSKSSLVDGICVSGVMAGKAAPYKQLRNIKRSVGNFPVIANTGVDFDNVNDILSIADACVVATCLKKDFCSQNRIDRNNVKKMMDLVRKERNDNSCDI